MTDRLKTADYVPPEVIDDEERACIAYDNICDDAVNRARTRAAKIPVGVAGTCGICEEDFERVVQVTFQDELIHACGRCRDDFKLG